MEETYDPVRVFVESALLAEDRGGVNIKRTIQEKLKNKIVQFSTKATPSKNTLIFGNHGSGKQPAFFYAPSRRRKRKTSSVDSKTCSDVKNCLPSTPERLHDLRELWNDYWKRQYKVFQNPKKILGRTLVFTGCELLVSSSPCKNEIGMRGVVVRETKHMFWLCFQNSKKKLIHRRIPKCKRTFSLVLRASHGNAKSSSEAQHVQDQNLFRFLGSDIISK